MAVPTTNINFSDIYGEANGGYTSGMLSLNTMSFFSYFSGPNGSNNQPANNWGQGEASGANRIYGTTAKTTNIKVGDFLGLDYFYDDTVGRLVTVEGTYNGPSPLTPPDPPDCYDMQINFRMWDDSFTYTYNCNGGVAVSPGSTFQSTNISQNNVTPMINTYYWELTVDTTPTYPGTPGGVTVDLFINGGTYISGVTINNGSNVFNSSVYGTATIALNQPVSGKTGSLWQVLIQ